MSKLVIVAASKHQFFFLLIRNALPRLFLHTGSKGMVTEKSNSERSNTLRHCYCALCILCLSIQKCNRITVERCYRCSIIGLESEDWECKGGQHIRNLERKEENWNFVIVEDGRGSSDPDFIFYWTLLERRAASTQL